MTQFERALIGANSARQYRSIARLALRMAHDLERRTVVKPVRTVRRVWIARVTFIMYGKVTVRKGHYRVYG